MPFEYTKNEAGEYVCPHCGETKKKQNTMHYHLKKHTGNLGYECNICKKEFLHKQALDVHKATHTKEKKQMLQCDHEGCEFQAVTKANMRIHAMRIHYKKETAAILKKNGTCFGCESCSKEFASGTAFYYHAWDCLEIGA